MQLQLTWTDFKTQVGVSGLSFKAMSINGIYYLIAGNDLFELDCAIVQDGGDDQLDYENNYASYAVTFALSPLAPGFYRNVTGNSTTVVKASPGVLMGIWINDNSTGGSVTVYDNTAGSGTKIGTIQFGTPSGGLLSSSGQPSPSAYTALNVRFLTGLTVVTAGATSNNITLVYR